MTDEARTRISTWNLILVPAVLTLAVTLLRLYGELQHWPKPWFSNMAGGGSAIVGISWLPFIFGPYFAMKLARAGLRPAGNIKTILIAFLGVVMVMGGAVVAFTPPISAAKATAGLLAMLIGTFLPFNPWPSLAKTLIAYGYAARIPVVLVMYVSIYGKWGTHYDALPAGYAGPTTLWAEYAFLGLIPQLLFWVGFTVTIGAFAGGIVAAVARRRLPAAESAGANIPG
jgi:hypothetical protein